MPRSLRRGSVGAAVEAAKRAVFRWQGVGNLSKLVKQPKAVRRTFGPFFATHVKRFQKAKGLTPDGVIGPSTWKALSPYLDSYAKDLLDSESIIKPVNDLIAPYQGFGSLHSSLWPAYTIGRKFGLLDGPGLASGTYNPASRLPGGGLSDHAYLPAYAFDLAVEPKTGWDNPNARKFFQEMIGRPEINYVILGDRIWSRSRGLHAYTSGGHENHVHVSGVH